MTRRVISCLLAALLAGPAAAEGMRLSEVLELARSTDAQFAAARAAADAGRERLPQARAALKPTLSLTHSIKRNRDGSSAYSGTLPYDGGGSSLVASQPIFRLVNILGVYAAEIAVELVELQLAAAEQDLLLRVSRAYFDVLQAGDELTVAVAQKEALAQQAAQARRSFEVGTVPITDLNESQARHDLAVAQEIAARNELESRRRILERSMGRRLPPLARLKENADPRLLDEARQATLVDQAGDSALPVRVARLAVQAAEKEIERREAGHTPTLDLVASVTRNRNVNYGITGGNDTRQASIGVELTVPLYQGGAVDSRTREARADRRRALEEQTQAERQAQLDAQQAQLGAQTGAALVRALQQALASSESQLRSTLRGLQVGMRTRVDVLNAEQQLYATRKDMAGARYRTLVSSLQLLAAAGALNESELRGLDALLD